MTHVTVAVVGDFMLNRPIAQGGATSASAGVWDLLEAADLVFINLECPLTAREAPADKVVAFRSDPALARDLRAVGVDVATVANNHMYDQGPDGLFDTLGALAESGVAAVGGGRNLDEALRSAVLTSKNTRVAFVGVATTLPVGSAAAPDRAGLAPVRVTTSYVADSAGLDETPGIAPFVETRAWPDDVTAVTQAVAAAKRAAGVCIVGIHWGVPNGWVAAFQDPIATYQRPLAAALIEAGADAVVGHHPHVLHGNEVIDGRPVFHSLGNFLFHTLRLGHQPKLRRPDPPYSWRSLRSKANLDSVIAVVDLESGRPAGVELIPVVVNEVGDPELARPDDAARILAALTEMSAPLGTTITTRGLRGHIRLEV